MVRQLKPPRKQETYIFDLYQAEKLELYLYVIIVWIKQTSYPFWLGLINYLSK